MAHGRNKTWFLELTLYDGGNNFIFFHFSIIFALHNKLKTVDN